MKVVILFLVATLVERSYGVVGIVGCIFANRCSQICTPTGLFILGYECSCRAGYQISPTNKYDCIPINTVCGPGYQSFNRLCIDIDECLNSPCQQTCTNSIGSYSCSCNSGYQPVSGDSSRCQPIAAACQPGYEPNPANLQQCIDIDECARNNPCNQRCTNLQGSYRCLCYSGYAISDRNINQCEAITICTKPRDIVILIDSSGSMTNETYHVQLQFIANLVRHFAVGPNNARFAAVVFGEDVTDLFRLHSKNDVAEEVVRAILSAPYKQTTTNTHLALDFIKNRSFYSVKQGGRDFAPNIAVLFTDGIPNNPSAAEQSAAALRNTGVEIIALGIGNEVNVEGLRRLATSDSHVFTSPSFDELPYVEKRLATFLCSG